MTLFNFNFDNKTLIIFITSILWVINFRTTFKNIDAHMDLGSYSSLKYNPRLYLIKNIICCMSFIIFYIEIKLTKSDNKKQIKIEYSKSKKDDFVIFEKIDEKKENGFFDSIYIAHRIRTPKEKLFFFVENILIIICIYFIEEIYFIFGNNHIMERIICPIRNLFIFLGLLIFYPLVVKKSFIFYIHQIIPFIIMIFLFIFLISFNAYIVPRFFSVFNATNIIIYFFLFILMALEMVLIKYLTDKEFFNIFLIIGIKGLIGTLFFIFINIFFNASESFEFIDKIMIFEYEDLYEKFNLTSQILYIITIVLVQYFKIYTINQFSEAHFLYTLMIADIIYFPFYCIERFFIQGFSISNSPSFFANLIFIIISFILVLIINEILECNCHNFNKDLKRSISERQFNEVMSTIESI